jgi:alkylation response protein AidB-like acyl-CoA dehydrogenase
LPNCVAAFPTLIGTSLDAKRAYPEAFVQALTKAGYMATLVPEEYGGAGLGVTELLSSSTNSRVACTSELGLLGRKCRQDDIDPSLRFGVSEKSHQH